MTDDKIDAPPPVWIAVLAADRSLIGFKRVDVAPAGAIIVPAGCDLACDGRYRWNDNARRFDPIPARVLGLGDTAAHNAMVLGVLAGLTDPATVPVEVTDAVAFIEASGAADEKALADLVAQSAQALLKRRRRPAAKTARK